MFESLSFVWTLFVFGTFWFWFLIAASSVGIIAFLEFDKRIGATLTFSATVAALVFLGNQSVLPWIFANPWHVVAGVAVYFVVAVIWAFLKWKFYIHSVNEYIDESKQRWILSLRERLDTSEKYEHQRLTPQQVTDYKSSLVTRTLVGVCQEDWDRHVEVWERERRRKMKDGYEIVPKPLKKPSTKEEVIGFVEDNKGRIISWMTYWPWSALWTLLNDPIRKLMKQIFYQIKGLLVSMAMSAFGVKEPVATAEQTTV